MDFASLVDALEKEVGSYEQNQLSRTDSGDEMGISMTYPVADQGDVILVSENDGNGNMLLAIIEQDGTKFYLHGDLVEMSRAEIHNSIRGKNVYLSRGTYSLMEKYLGSFQGEFVYLDEVEQSGRLRVIRGILPRWSATKDNPIARLRARVVVMYYLYLSVKYKPKIIDGERYTVKVMI